MIRSPPYIDIPQPVYQPSLPESVYDVVEDGSLELAYLHPSRKPSAHGSAAQASRGPPAVTNPKEVGELDERAAAQSKPSTPARYYSHKPRSVASPHSASPHASHTSPHSASPHASHTSDHNQERYFNYPPTNKIGKGLESSSLQSTPEKYQDPDLKAGMLNESRQDPAGQESIPQNAAGHSINRAKQQMACAMAKAYKEDLVD